VGRRSLKNYTKQQVVERDQARCWICFGPIDLKRLDPDPMSLTIDHVVPLSRGGRDTFKNVAASHKICNELKADKLPCEWTTQREGLLYRHDGRSAILLTFDSDQELYVVLNKLQRTRNKKLKNIIKNILEHIHLGK
jgi:hypothetical protein